MPNAAAIPLKALAGGGWRAASVTCLRRLPYDALPFSRPLQEALATPCAVMSASLSFSQVRRVAGSVQPANRV